MEEDLRCLLQECKGNAHDTYLVRKAIEDLKQGKMLERAKKIRRRSLVGATIASCTFPVLDDNVFDIILVDEASQVCCLCVCVCVIVCVCMCDCLCVYV